MEFSNTNIELYELQFVHEIPDEEWGEISRYALIGVFSSEKEAENAINILLSKPGFNKYSRENFIIGPYTINQLYWDSGFFKYYF